MALKSLSAAVEAEPYKKDDRSVFINAVLNDFIEVAFWTSGEREFQQYFRTTHVQINFILQ
jgi:hypothetical protein